MGDRDHNKATTHNCRKGLAATPSIGISGAAHFLGSGGLAPLGVTFQSQKIHTCSSTFPLYTVFQHLTTLQRTSTVPMPTASLLFQLSRFHYQHDNLINKKDA